MTQIKFSLFTILVFIIFLFSNPSGLQAQTPTLMYHPIVTDQNGHILPWYAPQDLGASYDHVMNLVWNFWINISNESNGVPQYLARRMHNINDPIGGDQIAMALSSWQLYYQYSGNSAVRANMEYMANFYLDYGLSDPTSSWPNIPFPANQYGSPPPAPGFYNGDVVSGVGVTQPDKAGSFGAELMTLYKMTGTLKYLNGARNIADTLASKVVAGDADNSPLPFKVRASTGEIVDSYTTNWTGTLRLFNDLIALNQGNVGAYTAARNTISAWLKTYPIQTNNWGPFFEDISEYSNTEINADTLAWYILEHPEFDPNWQAMARGILDYTKATFGNNTWNSTNWSQYGVLPINEQSAYPIPGNSHTSRHGSVELIYAEKTGDTSRYAGAIRQLNWATYMVDFDGKNKYPENEVWLTDGYGDYTRHYLRAMAAAPELAPEGQNHLLSSSSVVTSITYQPTEISFTTFDNNSREVLRLAFTPGQVKVNGVSLPQRTDLNAQGWVFDPATNVLRIRHDNGTQVVVTAEPPPDPPKAAPKPNFSADGDITLTWNRLTWASGYHVQIDTSTTFASPYYLDDPNLSDSQLSLDLTGVPDGTYYWRVRAKNANGVWRAWSPRQTFTVRRPPG